jgi:hypothetical protein
VAVVCGLFLPNFNPVSEFTMTRQKREAIAREASTAELIRSIVLYNSVLPIERNARERVSLQTRKDIVAAELKRRGIPFGQ